MHLNTLTRIRRAPALLVAGLFLCGALAASLAVDSSNAGESFNPHASSPRAHASEIKNVNVSMRLAITKIKGNTIYAQGQSTGEFAGTVVFHLTLVNATRAKASFNGGNAHGFVNGSGNANYHVSGSRSYFKGSLSSLSGHGKYKDLRSITSNFTGILDRQALEISVKLRGTWND